MFGQSKGGVETPSGALLPDFSTLCQDHFLYLSLVCQCVYGQIFVTLQDPLFRVTIRPFILPWTKSNRK